jgi:hypothetical protein
MCSKDEQKDFVEKLGEIVNLIDELTTKIDRSRLVLNDHCLEQARGLDLATETRIVKVCTDQPAIDKLNDIRRRLLGEINK